jgi:hypothetical protein
MKSKMSSRRNKSPPPNPVVEATPIHTGQAVLSRVNLKSMTLMRRLLRSRHGLVKEGGSHVGIGACLSAWRGCYELLLVNVSVYST